MAAPTTPRPTVLPKPASTADKKAIAAWRASLRAAAAWDKINDPEKYARRGQSLGPAAETGIFATQTEEEKAAEDARLRGLIGLPSKEGGEGTSASEGYQAKMDRLKKEAQAEAQKQREAADAGGSAPQDK